MKSNKQSLQSLRLLAISLLFFSVSWANNNPLGVDQVSHQQNTTLQFETWAKALASGNVVAIHDAAQKLKQAAPDSIGVMLNTLKNSKDLFVRIKIIEILANLRSDGLWAWQALREIIVQDQEIIREKSCWAINWMLSDGPEDCFLAMEANDAVVMVLIADLKNEKPIIRESSARGLAYLAPFLTEGAKDACETSLISCLQDDHVQIYARRYDMDPYKDTSHYIVREGAAWALEQLGLQRPNVRTALEKYYGQLLFESLDPKAEHDIKDVLSAFQTQEYGKALEAYKKLFFAKLSAMKYEEPWLWWMISDSNQLLSNYHLNCLYGAETKVKRYVGAPGAMDWFIVEPANPNWSEQISRMTWTGPLMMRKYNGYESGGNVQCLQHWVNVYSDFDSNYRHQAEIAEKQYKANLEKFHNMGVNGWKWPLHRAYRLEARMRGLAMAARCFPEMTISQVDAIQLSKVLVMAAQEIDLLVPWLLDPKVAEKTGIPGNQLAHSASAVMQGVAAMKEFKQFPTWMKGLQTYIEELEPYYADGTGLEQSFHYNAVFLEFARTSFHLFGKESELPFVNQIFNMGLKRYRFLSSIVRPSDVYTPGEAMSNAPLHDDYQSVFSEPMVDKIKSAFSSNAQVGPAFTSLAFPYSGYYVFRNGWNKENTHLYFKGGRKGTGHKSASANQVQLTAYGKTLLTRGGRRSYGAGPFPGHNEYQLSSFGYNTIVVDGQSQNNENAPLQKDTVKCRWISHDLLDFSEGKYSSGYKNIQEQIIHHRQVIYLKKFGLFLLDDRIGSDSVREYSQIWKFNEGFKPEQVQFSEQHITSTDPKGPNVELFNCSSTPMTYTKYYGQISPQIRGWVGCEPHTKAVDIFGSWKGSGPQQVLTVINPIKNSDSSILKVSNFVQKTTTGLELQLKTGDQISYLSSISKSQKLELGDFSVVGEGLLVCKNSLGEVYGLALGAETVAWKNELQTCALQNFIFKIEDSKFSVLAEIRIPKGMDWKNTEQGIVPEYK